MLYSMTGFGKATAELTDKKITVEIKSLNSKQVDLSAKLPSSLRIHEMELRKLVAARLERGKIDLTVSIEDAAGQADAPKVNVELLRAYHSQLRAAATTLGVAEPADWMTVLMRMPEVMSAPVATDASEEEYNAVLSALNAAMDALMAHRRTEGEKLEAFFAERIANISTRLAEIPQYETERVARIRTRIEEGLANIKGLEYDKSKIEQELFFYIEKLDINEEKQRLAQHMRYFMETMQADGAQGKKLGFITQEMGREINTLGSKSNHSDMQRLVVMMKDELEQIKEQVLNVM